MVDPKKIFTDPIDVEPGYEPYLYSIPYPSGGVRVNGLLMTAGGREKSPLVVVLHGFPGTERNLDVAQALRMAGCNVAFFHYRGAWGSPGGFSFTHVLEDPHNVIEYFKQPEIAEQYRIDVNNIFVIGHSMGGFAALLTGAARDDLRGVAGIAPYDFAKAYLYAQRDPASASSYRDVMGQPLPELDLVSPTVLLDELEANAKDWCFDNQVDKLAGKNVLVFGFDRDASSTMELHILPFIEKAKAKLGDTLRFENYNTDHSYNDKRVAVSRALAEWIASCVK
ncbi:MAG: alpha/beta fold hydrolase [Clostridia bacterium]|nr:alpha/beta fold hydrolase [Clostridia bacterium]